MPLGGFAPLPLRLGDDFTPEQHARMCADVAAAKRTAPLCVLTYVQSGATVTIEDYLGRDGEGLLDADGVARVTGTTIVAGQVLFALAPLLTDAIGVTAEANCTVADAVVHGSGGGRTTSAAAGNLFLVQTFNAAGSLADMRATVTVYTSDRDGLAASSTHADFRDYGGDVDKRASESESETPYAWVWYREIQAMRGSAYSKDAGTLVHAENIALARSEAARTRAAEKLVKNSIPSTADEKLESWALALAVHTRPGDRRADVRARCAAKFRAVAAPTNTEIDDAAAALLGDAYVRTDRQIGATLSAPPTITHWPVVNPGPAAYGISRDVNNNLAPWISERCHFTVVVQRPPSMSDGEFLDLMNIQLFELLDRMAPAWATFNWSLEPGFYLDVSELDFTGL